MGDLLVSGLRGLLSLIGWLWESRDRVRVVVLTAFILIAVTNWRFLRRVDGYRAMSGGMPPAGAPVGASAAEKPTAGAPSRRLSAAEELPFVSILVPARNEELNIEHCVGSLLGQDYPRFEVLVLDDESTDQTPAVLSRLAATAAGRLRVLAGQPLPSGWLGKHWACQQLAEASRGELLLFTDADTVHHPQMLADAVAAQRSESSDMLTGMPNEEVVSWGEKLVLPIMHWAMYSVMPLGVAHRVKSPLVSMAVGQFMLFRRSSFEALGGFEAVRSDPVDDMALARRTKKLGQRWRFVDLSSRVNCRMYRGFRGAVNGLGKSAFPSLNNNVWALALIIALLGWLYLGPLGTGLSAAMGMSPGAGALFWALSALGLALIGWMLVMWRFDYPWYRAFLFPVTIALMMGISLRSAYQFWRGETRWKGRVLRGLGDGSAGDLSGEALEERESPAK